MKRATVLVTLGGGGHTAQMIALTKALGTRVDYEYVIHDTDEVSEAHIVHSGRVYRVPRARTHYGNVLGAVLGTSRAFVQSFRIIRASAADVVISAGPGLAFPLFAWAKLFGKRTAFVETWSRVNSKSLAGRLCYPLSDVFFVQWPQLLALYKRSRYAGRLG
jgi:beta-1,4-N-acetylglucosaminyltransferase